MRHEFFVDFRELFETITTVHDLREYRLKSTVAKIRDSFYSWELNDVNWIGGKNNFSDFRTKWNAYMARRLNMMLNFGIWDKSVSNNRVIELRIEEAFEYQCMGFHA